jgi:hypothetical protein
VAKPGPLLLIVDGLVIGLMLWLLWAASSLEVWLLLLTYTAVFAALAVWSLANRYVVTIGPKMITVSTVLWYHRGEPPIRLDRAHGIEAEVNRVFWHCSATIDGMHLEAPESRSLNALIEALREERVPVRDKTPGWAQWAGIVGIAAVIFLGLRLMWSFGTMGVLIFAAVCAALLGLVLVHGIRVDRRWHQALQRQLIPTKPKAADPTRARGF